MSLRKQARYLVVQMLYQIDLNPDVSINEIREMIEEHGRSKTVRTFAWELFTGVMEFKPQLDEHIVRVAENWTLKRMAVTDRNILRLGTYELLHTDTPPAVVIDEAVELAREFGSAHSSQFVNGILDKVVQRKDEPLPPPPQAQEAQPEEVKPPEPPPKPKPRMNNPWAT
ncbi:transcription antitermination factor NusB [Gimesia sp.]|uniref:transcription antitermination factor NusB n=1 Tax=Gimesia sp. TaxID=2024833 RepID=UPI000C39D14B|nr:transcription antitermination factor NusB [Gimesia sp.]MAX37693.1 transcription antitermination factor NusB [Gimesia sp.]HBL47438.1 transcription antitermination factor NusB [Planctomycetaceae bacterium]|tara:strand:+ start:200 stop:709 length:510 start_codon:yes stop_codon:yes gene_type:complete